MIVIGIDPGLHGAVVALDNGRLAGCWDAPTVEAKRGRDYLVSEMGGIIIRARTGIGSGALLKDAVAYLEAARPHPKEGSLSSYKSGLGHGAWQAWLAAYGIPCHIITPREWQREAYAGINGKGKDRSIIAASRLFPDLEVVGPRGGKLDGRADAALIARYGWMKERR